MTNKILKVIQFPCVNASKQKNKRMTVLQSQIMYYYMQLPSVPVTYFDFQEHPLNIAFWPIHMQELDYSYQLTFRHHASYI